MGGEGKKGDFQMFEILTASTPLQCQLAPPTCQISCRSVKPFHTYGRLLNFSRWRLSCKSVKALRRYGCFWFFKMAAVRHLGLSKVKNFNYPYPLEGQNASSYQILCRSVEPLRRYGRLKIFKMAAVRHLGFVIRLFGPPTKCILVVSVIVQNLVWIGSVVLTICKF